MRYVLVTVMLVLAVWGSVCVDAGDGKVVEGKDADSTVQQKRSHVDDEVRIYYCSSCGYKQNFLEVKQYLEEKYPHLVDRVTGYTQPVGALKTMFAKVMGFVQVAGVILLMFGEHLLGALGWHGGLLRKALRYRLPGFAIIFFLGSFSQSMLSTGAFEVFFNSGLIFSKLQAGRWPTIEELCRLLEARGINAFY